MTTSTAIHINMKEKLGELKIQREETFRCYTDCYYNCYMCQGEGHSRLKLTKLGVGLREEITLRYKECGIKLCLTSS